jgi:predicted TIM-barrel fold metal-dependent hydrolase
MEPDIVFIGAHLGGLANELILAALTRIESLPSMDNLYLETSGCMNPKILSRAIEVLGDDRILWGTDAPFFDHEISRLVLKRTGVSESSMRKILYENATKLHS